MVISRTFELGKPYLSMTVPENVLVVAVSGHGLRGVVEGKEALDALNLGGLKDKKDIVAAQVNLSDRRFLEVAGAPASNPLIPLFDEPIAGLNPSEIMHMLRIVSMLTAGRKHLQRHKIPSTSSLKRQIRQWKGGMRYVR